MLHRRVRRLRAESVRPLERRAAPLPITTRIHYSNSLAIRAASRSRFGSPLPLGIRSCLNASCCARGFGVTRTIPSALERKFRLASRHRSARRARASAWGARRRDERYRRTPVLRLAQRALPTGAIHATERYTTSDDGAWLQLALEVVDPQAQETPLVVTKRWRRVPGVEMVHYGCDVMSGQLEGVFTEYLDPRSSSNAVSPRARDGHVRIATRRAPRRMRRSRRTPLTSNDRRHPGARPSRSAQEYSVPDS